MCFLVALCHRYGRDPGSYPRCSLPSQSDRTSPDNIARSFLQIRVGSIERYRQRTSTQEARGTTPQVGRLRRRHAGRGVDARTRGYTSIRLWVLWTFWSLLTDFTPRGECAAKFALENGLSVEMGGGIYISLTLPGSCQRRLTWLSNVFSRPNCK